MVKSKSSLKVSQVFDHEWLCRYPRPVKYIHDNYSEFIEMEFQELLSIYSVQSAPTTVKNPRGKAITERMHLTMAEMLRTMKFEGTQWHLELHSCLQAVV